MSAIPARQVSIDRIRHALTSVSSGVGKVSEQRKVLIEVLANDLRSMGIKIPILSQNGVHRAPEKIAHDIKKLISPMEFVCIRLQADPKKQREQVLSAVHFINKVAPIALIPLLKVGQGRKPVQRTTEELCEDLYYASDALRHLFADEKMKEVYISKLSKQKEYVDKQYKKIREQLTYGDASPFGPSFSETYKKEKEYDRLLGDFIQAQMYEKYAQAAHKIYESHKGQLVPEITHIEVPVPSEVISVEEKKPQLGAGMVPFGCCGGGGASSVSDETQFCRLLNEIVTMILNKDQKRIYFSIGSLSIGGIQTYKINFDFGEEINNKVKELEQLYTNIVEQSTTGKQYLLKVAKLSNILNKTLAITVLAKEHALVYEGTEETYRNIAKRVDELSHKSDLTFLNRRIIMLIVYMLITNGIQDYRHTIDITSEGLITIHGFISQLKNEIQEYISRLDETTRRSVVSQIINNIIIYCCACGKLNYSIKMILQFCDVTRNIDSTCISSDVIENEHQLAQICEFKLLDSYCVHFPYAFDIIVGTRVFDHEKFVSEFVGKHIPHTIIEDLHIKQARNIKQEIEYNILENIQNSMMTKIAQVTPKYAFR